MDTPDRNKTEVKQNGFTIINGLYSDKETAAMIAAITRADPAKDTFRKSSDLFAIRQLFKEIPELIPVVLNTQLKKLIHEIFGPDHFIVKSIYFDKPEQSNWYVAYHQDLTIAVDLKISLENFGPWTAKHNQYAVQPPVALLERNFTVRIHLDDTDADNGALRIIEGSHLKKICRPETINLAAERETVCPVKKGGIMIMKPLLLHRSGRSTNGKRPRVIHIEFSDQALPAGLSWAEKQDI
ncbi:MAG: phytanoyl-CoA dioxygenase [Sphingobacteriales bacterium]|nr:MAG: phytanoyl-CoA dioxygenase [Sphingobacteriales bacterium]